MHWFGSLLAGSKAVLLRGIKPEWILRTVSEEKITIVWLLVPWAQDILDAIDRGELKLEDYDLSQWRLMHIGAQPVPPSLIHRWKSISRIIYMIPTMVLVSLQDRDVSTWALKIFIK
ncbi:long-chain-fatty-acid-CoA ligase [Acetivibrio straminisolvens JCM 21531]|uniref:Long-chain-fatty-acid-CoA ligase n=1 Tax=Acetivibrio straminisolvens JCM 21531 TaxID=1294263 RepID=W4V5E3_9FIRM|nr:long-chain-fatty-acid-CoA ligase [Acetivibrio straminisolvens JCM 21531]